MLLWPQLLWLDPMYQFFVFQLQKLFILKHKEYQGYYINTHEWRSPENDNRNTTTQQKQQQTQPYKPTLIKSYITHFVKVNIVEDFIYSSFISHLVFSYCFSKFICCYVTIPNGNNISVKQECNKIDNKKTDENLVFLRMEQTNFGFLWSSVLLAN